MVGRVVLPFHPLGELAVEGVERRQVELADEELVADAAEEALDLALGGGVADGRVPQQAADAGADQGDLLGAVDGPVVDEPLFGHAALVEGRAEGLHHRIDVLLEEEFAVAEDPAGVVGEDDEFGLPAKTG